MAIAVSSLVDGRRTSGTRTKRLPIVRLLPTGYVVRSRWRNNSVLRTIV